MKSDATRLLPWEKGAKIGCWRVAPLDFCGMGDGSRATVPTSTINILSFLKVYNSQLQLYFLNLIQGTQPTYQLVYKFFIFIVKITNIYHITFRSFFIEAEQFIRSYLEIPAYFSQ